jgi:hypothetical protein
MNNRTRMHRTLARAHQALIAFGGLYVLAVSLLAIPLVQRQSVRVIHRRRRRD